MFNGVRVEFASAKFDEYENELINSLEENVLGLSEKVDKLLSLVGKQEQYSRRSCILIDVVKENQNEEADEVNKTKKINGFIDFWRYWSNKSNRCSEQG